MNETMWCDAMRFDLWCDVTFYAKFRNLPLELIFVGKWAAHETKVLFIFSPLLLDKKAFKAIFAICISFWRFGGAFFLFIFFPLAVRN